MLVKWFIDLQSPRKVDVITCCKITDDISVHNAVCPLLIFGEETFSGAGLIFFLDGNGSCEIIVFIERRAIMYQ